MSRAEAAKWVELWMAYSMLPVDGTMVLEAAALGDRFQISHFDSQILVVANRLGAELVYSEDLGHGQKYGEVQVRNPFLLPPWRALSGSRSLESLKLHRRLMEPANSTSFL